MKNKIKGFTLVELLSVIVIVGILSTIGIVAVSKIIEKSKMEQKKQQEKTIIMATKSYFQEHRSELPKVIGGSAVQIKLSKLKSEKFITEDIKDSSKNSCMTDSYVAVTKETTNKYKYEVFLICGE